MDIKPLVSQDRTQLEGLLRRIETFTADEVDCALELIDGAVQPSNKDYQVLVAARDGKVVGYVCYGPTPMTTGTFDLYWIAVSPTAQGKGLGARLLAASVDDARTRGATHMFIDTSTRDDYAAARALYLSQGFQLQGTLVDFYSDGDSKALYGRRL